MTGLVFVTESLEDGAVESLSVEKMEPDMDLASWEEEKVLRLSLFWWAL